MLRNRALVCLLAAASLVVSGCYTVKRYNAMNRAGPADLRAGTVSFIPFSGPVIKMKKVTRVEFPLVYGVGEDGAPAKVDLNRVGAIEVREYSHGKTAAVVVPVVLAVALAAGITVAVVASQMSSRSSGGSDFTSCPHVYLDRGSGPEFVGEAYSGAVFRTLQRQDLMPLPELAPGPVRLRLANRQPETDWTDLVQLVLVDHDPQVRAVSRRVEGPPLLVGPAAEPGWVRDLQGRDFTAQVRRRDGLLWQTDMLQASRRRRPLMREGLVASFTRPASGARPVLELTLVNSAWLDQVMMRFYASMGDLFPFYRWAASRPSQGPDLRRWREREGIDFAVEEWNGRTWDRIAVVPPVGPKALRHLALPLPAVRADSSEREIRVRVTGGPGFLRVDQLALSSEARQRAVVHTLRPASARDGEGQDVRPALEDADGHYHRLERIGDQLDLVFRQPPRAAGLRRAAFLRSVGFYSPWKPEDPELALEHVRKIWRQPGGLAHFSHGLLRRRMRGLRLAAAGAGR